MSLNLLEHALLAVAVGSVVFACAGVLLMHDVYERLHYLAAPGTVGVVALAGAVLIEEGLGQAALEVLVLAAIVMLSNAVLTHATARAARIRERGAWVVEPANGERGGEGRGEGR